MTGDVDLLALTFLRPAWLLALPIAIWVAWHRPPAAPSKSPWAAVIDPHLRPFLIQPQRPRNGRAHRSLLGASLVLAIIAMAGPAMPGAQDIALRGTASRVLLVDLSPGAEASTRRVRARLLDLLHRMPPGQTAIVAYAEEPYLIAPPTTDVATLRLLVPELAPEVMPQAGHRPERALQMAQDLLVRNGSRASDVLWITSHADTAPDTLDALHSLRLQGIRVSRMLATPLSTANAGGGDVIRSSGGLDLSLDASESEVAALVALWEERARSAELVPAGTTAHRELGPWLALLILPLALPLLRPGWLLVLVVPVLHATPSSHAADLSDPRWQAVAHYRAGRFAEAAASLEKLSDADSLYNRGTALARLHRFEEALGALDQALALRPDDPDIRHNRAVVEALMQQPPPDRPPASPRPPDSPPPSGQSGTPSTADIEAARLAEQWQRRVPDEPGSLLREKLRLEHARRQRDTTVRPWQ